MSLIKTPKIFNINNMYELKNIIKYKIDIKLNNFIKIFFNENYHYELDDIIKMFLIFHNINIHFYYKMDKYKYSFKDNEYKSIYVKNKEYFKYIKKITNYDEIDYYKNGEYYDVMYIKIVSIKYIFIKTCVYYSFL